MTVGDAAVEAVLTRLHILLAHISFGFVSGYHCLARLHEMRRCNVHLVLFELGLLPVGHLMVDMERGVRHRAQLNGHLLRLHIQRVHHAVLHVSRRYLLVTVLVVVAIGRNLDLDFGYEPLLAVLLWMMLELLVHAQVRLVLLLRCEYAAVVHLALVTARRQRLLLLNAQLRTQIAVLGGVVSCGARGTQAMRARLLDHVQSELWLEELVRLRGC